MIPLRLDELAVAVEGSVAGDPSLVVDGPVVVDSRQAAPHALFAALPGRRTDGHDHVRQALAAGAVASLVARPVEGPFVLVADVERALGRLARRVVDRLADLTVVGITGSSGKTSTKDLLAAVLAAAGPTVAPAGSLNNEIGLPLTALSCDASTRFLVAEMGMRGLGQITYLCEVTPPGIGVVLNVGTAHLGELGSVAAIAQAKGELVEALPPEGFAVLNADDPLVRAMSSRTHAQVVTFGESASADVRADDVAVEASGRASFTLVAHGASARVTLRLVGEHQVGNALAAAAAGLSVGLDVAAVAAGLSAAEPRSRWRMEVRERPDGVTVINDAYNANPESVRAALKALVAMARGRRTVAVLGQMLELGAASVAEHDAIGRLAVRLDVDQLVVVGEGARTLHLGAALEGSWNGESVFVPDVGTALSRLREIVRPGDVVLVKASRGIGLERVAEGLLEGADA